ncbi:MAG: hypothetical protein U0Y82_07560 [Thermoleophilia bacterium]
MAEKKAKAAKGGKQGKGAKGAQPNAVALWTQRARGIGLLLGFAIAFWVSRGEGLPTEDCLLRGVGGAIALSVVTWWCSLMIIQAVMRTAAHRQHMEAVRAHLEAQAEMANNAG